MKSTRQIDFVINADDVESMSRLAQIKEWKPDFDGARFEYLLEFDAKILHPIVRQCAATKLFIVRQEAGNDQGDRFHFDIQRIADAIGALLKKRSKNRSAANSLTITGIPFDIFSMVADEVKEAKTSRTKHIYKITFDAEDNPDLFAYGCWCARINGGYVQIYGRVVLSFNLKKPTQIHLVFEAAKMVGHAGQIVWDSGNPESRIKNNNEYFFHPYYNYPAKITDVN